MVYDVLLEVRLARMMDAHTVALLMREVVIGDAEHVHLHTGGHQPDCGTHMLWDAGGCVERNGSPDVLDITLRHPVALHEVARGIGAVDLEAQVRAGIFLGEAHVVEHGAKVKQFRIKF